MKPLSKKKQREVERFIEEEQREVERLIEEKEREIERLTEEKQTETRRGNKQRWLFAKHLRSDKDWLKKQCTNDESCSFDSEKYFGIVASEARWQFYTTELSSNEIRESHEEACSVTGRRIASINQIDDNICNLIREAWDWQPFSSKVYDPRMWAIRTIIGAGGVLTDDEGVLLRDENGEQVRLPSNSDGDIPMLNTEFYIFVEYTKEDKCVFSLTGKDFVDRRYYNYRKQGTLCEEAERGNERRSAFANHMIQKKNWRNQQLTNGDSCSGIVATEARWQFYTGRLSSKEIRESHEEACSVTGRRIASINHIDDNICNVIREAWNWQPFSSKVYEPRMWAIRTFIGAEGVLTDDKGVTLRDENGVEVRLPSGRIGDLSMLNNEFLIFVEYKKEDKCVFSLTGEDFVDRKYYNYRKQGTLCEKAQ